MSACEHGQLEIARFLVEQGIDYVNAARTTDGSTALMWASQNGHLDIARLLIGRGANIYVARTDTGFTALMSACSSGHLETVCLLLQHGADRHALSHAGETAHDLAASHPILQAALR